MHNSFIQKSRFSGNPAYRRGQCCPFTGISVVFTTFLIVLGVVWYLKKVVLVFIQVIGLIVLGWVHYICDWSGRRTAIVLLPPTHTYSCRRPRDPHDPQHGRPRPSLTNCTLWGCPGWPGCAWFGRWWPAAASPCRCGVVGGSGGGGGHSCQLHIDTTTNDDKNISTSDHEAVPVHPPLT